LPMAEVFKLAVSNFKVNDWNLFGNWTTGKDIVWETFWFFFVYLVFEELW
jgi:hypothetical protein